MIGGKIQTNHQRSSHPRFYATSTLLRLRWGSSPSQWVATELKTAALKVPRAVVIAFVLAFVVETERVEAPKDVDSAVPTATEPAAKKNPSQQPSYFSPIHRNM